MITVNKSQLNLHSITDQYSHHMNSIRIEETKEKTRAVATNGRLLAIVDHRKINADDPDFKDVKISMPAELAKETARELKKDATARVGFENGKVTARASAMGQFANDNYNFPNYHSVIPTDTPKATIRLDPKLLIDLLKTAVMALDGGSVVLEVLDDESKPMRIVGENGSESFLGLIMPTKNK